MSCHAGYRARPPVGWWHCLRVDSRGSTAADNRLVIEIDPGRFEDTVLAGQLPVLRTMEETVSEKGDPPDRWPTGEELVDVAELR